MKQVYIVEGMRYDDGHWFPVMAFTETSSAQDYVEMALGEDEYWGKADLRVTPIPLRRGRTR